MESNDRLTRKEAIMKEARDGIADLRRQIREIEAEEQDLKGAVNKSYQLGEKRRKLERDIRSYEQVIDGGGKKSYEQVRQGGLCTA